MARPRKIIEKKGFEKLCELQCTRDEICGFFEVDDMTLNKWCKETYGKTFSAVYGEKRASGKISLRRRQFNLAETNATMAIWLGKQWLGQTDTPQAVVLQQTEEDLLSKAFSEFGGNL